MMRELHSKFQQIWRRFCHFENFGCKTGFSARRTLMIGTSSGGKICIFGFFMIYYVCSGMAEAFYQILGCLKGQKHSKNGLSATFCTSRNQSWVIAVLEGKMTSKLKNSTCFGYQIDRAFQRAIMSSIWTSGSASKSPRKWHDT